MSATPEFQSALPEHVRAILAPAEQATQRGAKFEQVLPILRRLSLDDFGLVVWSMPDADWPGLSGALPPMAPDDVQRHWTGQSGSRLLHNTVWFPHLLALAAARFGRRPIEGSHILDVGCGYGRLARFAYYFTDPADYIGVDTSAQALAYCASLPGTFAHVEAVPTEYPVHNVHLAFAFSLFTHLSEEAAHAVLGAIRRALRPDGLAVVTVRPIEYWERLDAAGMVEAHRERGFAYTPHHPSTPHYGDASISLDYIARLPGWEMLAYEHPIDSLQIAVVLRPL